MFGYDENKDSEKGDYEDWNMRARVFTHILDPNISGTGLAGTISLGKGENGVPFLHVLEKRLGERALTVFSSEKKARAFVAENLDTPFAYLDMLECFAAIGKRLPSSQRACTIQSSCGSRASGAWQS